MSPRPVACAPLEGGHGIALASVRPGPDLAAAGWTEHEYAASGTAVSYRADDLPADRRLALRPSGEEAAFTTRVVVRRPARAVSSATLVVE